MEKKDCNEDCFHCIYEDCIMDILPREREKQRERQRLYYQRQKEKKKVHCQRQKGEIKNAK